MSAYNKQEIIAGYIAEMIHNSITYNGDLPMDCIHSNVSDEFRKHAADAVTFFCQQAGRSSFLAEQPHLAGQLLVRDRNGASGGFADHQQSKLEQVAEKMPPVFLGLNDENELIVRGVEYSW